MKMFRKNEFFNTRGSFGQVFSPLEPTYTEHKFNCSSTIELNDRCDFVNTYDKIQAYKDECDIYNILARVANGETALLGNASWDDFDATAITADYMTKQANLDKAVDFFNHLPTDIKELFNNDFREFSSDGGVRFEKIVKDLQSGGFHNSESPVPDSTDNKQDKE